MLLLLPLKETARMDTSKKRRGVRVHGQSAFAVNNWQRRQRQDRLGVEDEEEIATNDRIR